MTRCNKIIPFSYRTVYAHLARYLTRFDVTNCMPGLDRRLPGTSDCPNAFLSLPTPDRRAQGDNRAHCEPRGRDQHSFGASLNPLAAWRILPPSAENCTRRAEQDGEDVRQGARGSKTADSQPGSQVVHRQFEADAANRAVRLHAGQVRPELRHPRPVACSSGPALPEEP